MHRRLIKRLRCTCCLAVWAALAESLSHFPILFDSSNHLHRDIQYHPEQAERIAVCIQALQTYIQQTGESCIHLVDVTNEPSNDDASRSDAKTSHEPFSQQELENSRAMLVQAHSKELVSKIQQQCHESRQRRIEEGKNPLGFIGYIDHDTYLTTETYDVCLRATAAWIRAVDLVLEGDKDGAAAMALTRPPGHHATAALSNGFCIFNFAAAAALHAIQRDSNLKVSMLDWDVHYGQGVADIVVKYDRIRYVSIHQVPAFPYMGETRSLLGEYKNVLTIPILADNTWTCGYKEYFNNVALPFVQSVNDSWEPDLVIVCAGYDALASDELASVSLTAPDYHKMTRALLKHLSVGREKRAGVVFGLEGGYQLTKGVPGGNLADAVLETVCAVLEEKR